MKSISKWFGTAGITASLALGAMLTLAVGSSATADSEPWSRGLEGTWRVQVTLVDCASGAPLPSPTFAAMLTFVPGGTLTGTTASPAFKAGQRSPDHGVWSRTGWRRYRAVSEAFILFDSPPPPLPLQRGTQRITQAIEMDDDQFRSKAFTEYFDAGGNVVNTGCATAIGHRFE